MMNKKVRIFIAILLCVIAKHSFAQNDSYIYAHSDKYMYRQMVVVDEKTGKLIQDFGYGNNGVIMFFADQGVECVAITFGEELLYSIQVVNTVTDYPTTDIKVEMKQGGVMQNEKCVCVIDVFRTWDFSTDKLTPQVIRTHVDGAGVAFEFYDISIVNK